MESTGFQRLVVEGWRQFKCVDLELHPRLTIITGANGTGKSTLLSVFSQHFGWHRNLLATPIQSKNGGFQYFSGVYSLRMIGSLQQDRTPIGRLGYANGVVSEIFVPLHNSIEYGLQIESQQSVSGVNIPSHRAISRFQQVGSIPTNSISAEQAYGAYVSELMNRFHGNHSQYSPVYRMKESLISMAAFGEGNRYLEGRPELLQAYTGFIDALRKMLPETLGFQTLAIRTPDVVMVTETGEFLIDAVSGGLAAIIDLTWQVHMYSMRAVRPVVVMDEPENHLHPSMQRTLMSKLLDAFPSAQFIVATHSPFVVSSERDCNVYALRYESSGGVEKEAGFAPMNSVVATKLDLSDTAGTANDILVEVLGLETTLPEWAERKIQGLIGRLQEVGVDAETYREVTAELARAGLGKAVTRVMGEVLGK